MGTKALNGMTHQFLLKTRTIPPPAETVGECKEDSCVGTSGVPTWQVQQVLSLLDREIIHSCMDRDFLLALRRI